MAHDATSRLIGLLFIGFAGGILLLAIAAHHSTNKTAPNVTPTPKQGAQLVTTGIYQQVRHPIYTAVLIGILGAAMSHGAGVLYVLWLVFVGFFWAKSRYEEVLLRQTYADYVAYEARSHRFVPYVW